MEKNDFPAGGTVRFRMILAAYPEHLRDKDVSRTMSWSEN